MASVPAGSKLTEPVSVHKYVLEQVHELRLLLVLLMTPTVSDTELQSSDFEGNSDIESLSASSDSGSGTFPLPTSFEGGNNIEPLADVDDGGGADIKTVAVLVTAFIFIS